MAGKHKTEMSPVGTPSRTNAPLSSVNPTIALSGTSTLGDGRKAATAAGAVAGGVIGNNVAANSNDPPARPPRYATQRRCRPVAAGAGQRQVVGYDVEYRYRGEVYNARMNTDPGDRMRVKVTVTPAE